MYYARFNNMGTNYKGNEFVAFGTRSERDAWVQEHEFNGANIVATSCTRKEVEDFYPHRVLDVIYVDRNGFVDICYYRPPVDARAVIFRGRKTY